MMMILLNSDLLKIGKPSWFGALSCHGLGKVGSVLRAVYKRERERERVSEQQISSHDF